MLQHSLDQLLSTTNCRAARAHNSHDSPTLILMQLSLCLSLLCFCNSICQTKLLQRYLDSRSATAAVSRESSSLSAPCECKRLSNRTTQQSTLAKSDCSNIQNCTARETSQLPATDMPWKTKWAHRKSMVKQTVADTAVDPQQNCDKCNESSISPPYCLRHKKDCRLQHSRQTN